MNPRVLVACPTCEKKDYAFERWATAYDEFTYPAKSAFMVDNTKGSLDYVHRIREAGIPAVHIEPLPNIGINFTQTLELCWREIAYHAACGGYEYVASIESDVICPPRTLDVLLAHAEGKDIVGHSYPLRSTWHAQNGAAMRIVALGCTLVRTDWLCADMDLWVNGPEQDLWRTQRAAQIENLLEIQHLEVGE